MGPEVMCSRDNSPPTRTPPSDFSPFFRKKPFPSKPFNTRSNPSRSYHVVGSYSSSPVNPRYAKKSQERGKKKGRDMASSSSLVMGKVTILKRGQSFDQMPSGSTSKENRGRSVSTDGVRSSNKYSDGLKPVPAEKPKHVRLGSDPRPSTSSSKSGAYAGPSCAFSPSPSAVPLPTFPLKRQQQSCAAAVILPSFETSATENLRRLLRLA